MAKDIKVKKKLTARMQIPSMIAQRKKQEQKQAPPLIPPVLRKNPIRTATVRRSASLQVAPPKVKTKKGVKPTSPVKPTHTIPARKCKRRFFARMRMGTCNPC